jgi:hypothetical protein
MFNVFVIGFGDFLGGFAGISCELPLALNSDERWLSSRAELVSRTRYPNHRAYAGKSRLKPAFPPSPAGERARAVSEESGILH